MDAMVVCDDCKRELPEAEANHMYRRSGGKNKMKLVTLCGKCMEGVVLDFDEEGKQ